MLHRIQRFLLNSLESRTHPLAYLSAYLSWAVGLFFTFFTFLPDVKGSLIYRNLLVSPHFWGAGVLVFGTWLLSGMFRRSRCSAQVGAMGGFILWMFAAIFYIKNEYWYALSTFAAYNLLSQGYLYLSISLDNLWDKK